LSRTITATPADTVADSARRILPLAWPVFVGQLSVIAFGTIDTLLVARHSTRELAALAVGGSIYFTIFIGFMGAVMALGPIVGQLFGAKKLRECGAQLHQAVWLALAMSLPGCLLLMLPGPLLALAQLKDELETIVRNYLMVLALALPAALLFSVFRAFNTAISRPKAVMVLQLWALAVKLPLSWFLLEGVPALGIPALGLFGCALATVIVMWGQVIFAARALRRDRFYAPFVLFDGGRWALQPPDFSALRALARLGLPIGLSVLIEVSGFTLMAVFIARLGAVPVAAHQIAANLMSILFMMPLALSQGASTLVAQHVGAQEWHAARRMGWHAMAIGLALAAVFSSAVVLLRAPLVSLYTQDPAVIAVALAIIAWLVAFHIADAAQTVAAFVLRAWHVATGPMLIYAASLGGVGLGGGYLLAFNVTGNVPAWLQGAPGFWAAGTAGLVVAALALSYFLVWVLRQKVPNT
jgi:multidrug resistance protein, MATE family